MPFGLKNSQDILQMWIDQETDHLPSIVAIHDDICAFGHIHEVYDEHLLCLMKTAKDHDIVFNIMKCHIRQPHIAFIGTVFTTQGMQPDSAKIQARQDLPTPNSQAKLQSFLGLINYLQSFIPGLSAKTTFLQEQLGEWDWNPSTDAAFQCLKTWICQALLSATLAYYNRSKPVIMQMDASKYELGAALIQSSHPIAFASKMLTDIEIHYANIESVCWYASVWRNSTPTSTAGMSL